MRPELAGILCCPVTHRSLHPATPAKLGEINRSIAAGTAVLGNGERWQDPLEAALLTADGNLIYRLDDGIPVLLEVEAITLDHANA